MGFCERKKVCALMSVEAGEGVMAKERDRDEFPVGMRVLAVDDDPICLKVLGTMLRQCKYHVTTTNQAITALKILRANKDNFDLIITDVHMPDMDGFKLLELVGLEMDLPVIMSSANGTTEVMMKGITHGACDYLLKPVQLKELQNIWQHVIRKKKRVPSKHNNSDNGTNEVGPVTNTSGSSEYDANRKRKDHNEEDEDDDNEENANENDNTSTRKKARVVWSYELHHKFMAAVDHLGIDKAVPKRILELMNVEGLTRGNVASHLQKYRLYIKKVSSQGANIAAALGVRDSYLPLGSPDSFENFHSLALLSQLTGPRSFHQNGEFIRKDSTLFGQNIAHGMVQVGHTQNASIHINDPIGYQHITGRHYENLIQSIPTTVDQLQQRRRMIHEANNRFPSNFSTNGLSAGGSNNPIGVIPNSPLMLQSPHSSIGLPSVCSGPFEVKAGVSSHFSDPARCNETLQSAILSTSKANSLASSGGSPFVSQVHRNPLSISSCSTSVAPLYHPVMGDAMLMLKGDELKYLKFGGAGNTQHQVMVAKQDHAQEPNVVFGSALNPTLAHQSIVAPPSHGQLPNNPLFSERPVATMNGQTNYSSTFLPQQCKIDKSVDDGQLRYKDPCSLESSSFQDWL